MDLPGAEGSRGQDGPVEDEVGGPQQQRAVLGARGLALGRVDDDDRAAPAPARRRELAGQRESGTDATSDWFLATTWVCVAAGVVAVFARIAIGARTLADLRPMTAVNPSIDLPTLSTTGGPR